MKNFKHTEKLKKLCNECIYTHHLDSAIVNILLYFYIYPTIYSSVHLTLFKLW